MADVMDVSGEVREEMAYKLAPALKTALATAGSHATLLAAHSCLQDANNTLQLSVPEGGPDPAAVVSVRVRIRIRIRT
jgi:hypothetical protein